MDNDATPIEPVELPRGGYLVRTPAGSIQFGAPPETIKDTMGMPGSVPRIYVLPDRTFHWRRGINLADLEFPIYYNFFLKQKKTYICCTREQAGRMMRALQEAVFGPIDLDIESDMYPTTTLETPPIAEEAAYFRNNLEFHDLFSFCILEDGKYAFGDVTVEKLRNGGFRVLYRDSEIGTIPASFEYKARYDIGSASKSPYRPPLFGITCLGPSHGFDPKENTSGYIIWLNHSGIMVDPPVDSTRWLEDSNVNPKFIDSIILTHCHADHDAGTFQKVLAEERVTVYTTPTVMQSFLRKYSAFSGETEAYLSKLFNFQPVYIGNPIYIHGGEFCFTYRLHSLPTIGFTVRFQDESFVYSSDHQASPEVHDDLLAKGIISEARHRELSSFPWDADVIYHEAGIPPLHTPIAYLATLDESIQNRTIVYHIATKDFLDESSLTLATFGVENTKYFDIPKPAYEESYLVLDVLKHLDFFDTLPVEKIQSFFTLYREARFEVNEPIITEGSTGDTFYIVASGNVVIQNDRLQTSKRLGEYEYFGEVALLTGKLRTANVVAENDVILFTLGRSEFLSFIAGTEFEQTLQRLVHNRNEETWNVLTASTITEPLTNYQKSWLESYLEPVDQPGSGVILRENEEITDIYFIREGEVIVERAGERIATLKRGDYIGAMNKIQRGERADYTFRHEADVGLFRVSEDHVKTFINRNPGCGMKLSYSF